MTGREARLNACIKQLRRERDEMLKSLNEALDAWEYSASYKGEYLEEKHGDRERVSELRAF